MASRLAFQTQLASIMEVLANAAVAEICKLVDDDYAVVSLQMSQCQKENKALKRKLHLLELKMARGTAERRLRESAFNSSRMRVQLSGGTSDRLREITSPAADGAFEQQQSLWPQRALTSGATEEPQCPPSKSPDVEFVDPVVVKEETKCETKQEDDVHLIEDNDIMQPAPCAADGPRISQVQSCAKTQSPPRPLRRKSATNRRVETEEAMEEDQEEDHDDEEDEEDLVLVKVEQAEGARNKTPSLNIQEGLVESSTDNFKAEPRFPEAELISANQIQEPAPGLSESGGVQMKIPGSSLSGPDLAFFELEPFFSCWAPDEGSTAPPCGSVRGNASTQKTFSGERRPGKGQPQPRASQGLSSIQIQAVHSRWTPAAMRNAHSLPNNTTQQQTHPNIHDLTLSPSSAPSTSAASNQMFQFLTTPPRQGGKKFICKVCGKPFPALWNLSIHQRVHTGERPFKCDTCGRRFAEAGNLKKHQRVHTGEKPYSCNQCGRSFAWICNLKKHQQSPYGCVQQQARA